MAYSDLRYSSVPWLDTLSDLRAVGEPETCIDLPGDRTLGLHVRAPFGKDSDGMLTIRAVDGNGNDGGTITLQIGSVVQRETEAPAPMHLLSNPRRVEDEKDWR